MYIIDVPLFEYTIYTYIYTLYDKRCVPFFNKSTGDHPQEAAKFMASIRGNGGLAATVNTNFPRSLYDFLAFLLGKFPMFVGKEERKKTFTTKHWEIFTTKHGEIHQQRGILRPKCSGPWVCLEMVAPFPMHQHIINWLYPPSLDAQQIYTIFIKYIVG